MQGCTVRTWQRHRMVASLPTHCLQHSAFVLEVHSQLLSVLKRAMGMVRGAVWCMIYYESETLPIFYIRDLEAYPFSPS